MEIWVICENITNKKDWYKKVFDSILVEKWKSEAKSDDNFDLAIKLLQTTAKGSNILKDCEWDVEPCDDCINELKYEILQNPEDFDIDNTELAILLTEPYWYNQIDHNMECSHVKCKCSSPHSLLEDYIDYYPDGLLSKELHNECKNLILEMSKNEKIDWHPGSNNQVRDIIHPSMYCYVKGLSKYKDGTLSIEAEENKRYQWLPSRFDIDNNGKVKIMSYINNLNTNKYPQFIELIENVFEKFIPSFERIIERKLINKSLQVIVKVGSIILTNNNNNKYPGGSYHLEGVPEEHIIATGIHYVDVENITESFLEFRKPTIINEENVDYEQNDQAYTKHHYGIEDHWDGQMNKYLGLIKCSEGADVIFPNTLQHRVKEFDLVKNESESLRTILAFFLIDPDHKIISTEDIDPQQKIFSIEEANFHRERLMYHRKYYIDQLNEEVFMRPFSLCEH